MPNPGDPDPSSLSPEESFLELLAATIENMDRGGRAQFLRHFFRMLAQLDLTEVASLEYWDQIIRRRGELSKSLEKSIPLRIAIVEVLASSSHLRVPILMEYEQLKKLQINAATDPLTGLYNRRLFEDHFARELNRAIRYNQHLTIVILDLHQFKEINDRYGHARGDVVLRTVAATLDKSLRTSDYAFRIGGDEFALLLVQSDKDQGDTLAKRICVKFAAAAQSLQMPSGLQLDYGLAVCPEDGDQKETLLRVADERLYEMKSGQRVSTVAESPKPPARRPTSAANDVFGPAARVAAPSPRGEPERRKWDRVQLAGTRAFAQLSGAQTVRIIDLGYGGVSLEFDTTEDLSSSFEAVLHVPILPSVRVNLKTMYQVNMPSGHKRVGCVFSEKGGEFQEPQVKPSKS